MIPSERVFVHLICCLCILSACGGSGTDAVTDPVDVIFDSQGDETIGGVRLAPQESHWDGYGEAVDVHRDVLVVGAPEWNQLGPGSVYVYRLSKAGWLEEAQLTASDRDVLIEQKRVDGGQHFGNSVAVGDGIIIVGAPGNVQAARDGYRGAVYVFEYNGDSWIETTILTPSLPVQNAEVNKLHWLDYGGIRPRVFGSYIALEDDTLAVGGDADGTVYIYQRGENGWQEQAHTTVPEIPERDFYMTSLSIYGDALAVSAYYLPPQPDPLLILTGSVGAYVFERTESSWEESFRFLPDDGELEYIFLPGINVGASVALGGESGEADLLAVGLPGFPDWTGDLDERLVGVNPDQVPEFPASNRQSGAVYIFGREGQSRWRQQATLKPEGWDSPPGPGSLSGFPSHLEEGQSDAEKAAFYASFVFPGHIYSEAPEITFFGTTVDLDGSLLAATSGFANTTYIFERQDGAWTYRLRLKPQNEKLELWEDFSQLARISNHTVLLGTPGEFGNSAYVFDLCGLLGQDCR